MIGDSNDKTNFPHELLLTERQFLVLVKHFQIIHQLILIFKNSTIKNDTVRRISR